MRTTTVLLASLLLTVVSRPQSTGPMPGLVSTQWLQQHQHESDLVVLHVGFSRRDYLREHIPGARFIWFSWLSPSTPDESTVMASAADAKKVLEELGITQDSRIVVCFTGNNLSTTTRTIFSLVFFGFEGRVALLDGGLDGWKRAGGAVTREVPVANHTSLSVTVRPELLADAEFVRQHLNDPSVTIVDARSKSWYDGTSGGTRPGHVKGAVSLPYSTVADTMNQFKPTEALEKVFRDAGVKKGSTIVAYCHVGQQATIVLHAARSLGYAVRLYDGSFEEWASLDEARYPVASAADEPNPKD